MASCFNIPPNFWKLFYMNLILTIHLSLCLALIALLPQIAEQNGYTDLGKYSIMTVYLTEFLFNIIAPAYLKNRRFNYAFLFQAILVVPCFFVSDYLANCRNGNDTSWICKPSVMSPLSISFTFLLGVGLAGYFILQNFYVSQCSSHESSEIMFSTTYIFLGCSSMLSGFYANVMLQVVSRSNFFWVSGIIELILSLLFFFIKTPTKSDVLIFDSKVNQEDLEIETEENSISKNIQNIFKTMFDKSSFIYYPIFWTSGIIIGFEYGLLYQFINKSLSQQHYDLQTVNEITASVYLTVGIAQILGALLNGFIKKLFKSNSNIILYANILCVVMFVSLVDSFVYDLTLTKVLGFFLGFADMTGQFTSSITISEQYKDPLSIYGVYFSMQNFSIAFMIAQATFLQHLHLAYNLCIITLSQIAVNVSIHYLNKKKHE
ncbi:unnamed protein product [Paramecium octaurelia]|uniref:Uncharacterized protein n=1 Tax=Paramecium octaurelia TaxID=43137 RepID=A0A8S1UK94_PAROT|nr:unnamed protein product [Paramecium octaurelia]